ncbi:CPBP family intramembrane glutamic endopeptidase [Massilia niastensis]|uniref:CPBP family intramembrane glutamic endopeptidase n=1 Tax=Massilia niastensis TaxID=544911 RepID=UPI0003681FB0|nr:CPBP family intramembrane glutamic endopeptidase [Massilia niastensis]
MLFTFGLLFAAIAVAWLPPLRVGATFSFAAWQALLGAAVVAGLVQGFLSAPALVALALLAALAVGAERAAGKVPRVLLLAAAMLVILALALHAVPGFHNPKLFDQLVVSTNAPPFTMYLNFDKAAAGLVLLGLLCTRVVDGDGWRRALGAGLAGGLLTAAAVLGIGLALGYIAFDPNDWQLVLQFGLVNLLFVCVAEEVFFRGVLQERLQRAWAGHKAGAACAVALSSLLFGLAHLGGGVTLFLLATLAGAGYGVVYARTRSIEAAILAHVLLNVIHFAWFTYPRAL